VSLVLEQFLKTLSAYSFEEILFNLWDQQTELNQVFFKVISGKPLFAQLVKHLQSYFELKS